MTIAPGVGAAPWLFRRCAVSYRYRQSGLQ